MFLLSRKTFKILGWSLAVVSIIFLTLSVVAYVVARRFVDTAARTEGVVTGLVESRDTRSGSSYRPVFVFRDGNQVAHEIQSNVGSNPPAYKIGDRVSVLYATEKPDNAAIDSFLYLWFFPLLFGLLGTVQLAFALIFFGIGKLLKRAAS
jgi:hypothetical protein